MTQWRQLQGFCWRSSELMCCISFAPSRTLCHPYSPAVVSPSVVYEARTEVQVMSKSLDSFSNSSYWILKVTKN